MLYTPGLDAPLTRLLPLMSFFFPSLVSSLSRSSFGFHHRRYHYSLAIRESVSSSTLVSLFLCLTCPAEGNGPPVRLYIISFSLIILLSILNFSYK